MTQQSKFKEWAIPAVGAAAVLSLGLFAAGCGGGGSAATTTTTGTVSATVGDGPVSGATVDFYAADGTFISGSTKTTDSYGQVDVTFSPALAASKYPLKLIVRADGKGTDTVTNKTLSVPLMGIVPSSTATVAHLTPLTTLIVKAAEKAAGGFSKITTANLTKAQNNTLLAFGGSSIGVDVLNTAANSFDSYSAATFSVLNEGIAELFRKVGMTGSTDLATDNYIAAMIDDASDGLLDGYAGTTISTYANQAAVYIVKNAAIQEAIANDTFTSDGVAASLKTITDKFTGVMAAAAKAAGKTAPADLYSAGTAGAVKTSISDTYTKSSKSVAAAVTSAGGITSATQTAAKAAVTALTYSVYSATTPAPIMVVDDYAGTKWQAIATASNGVLSLDLYTNGKVNAAGLLKVVQGTSTKSPYAQITVKNLIKSSGTSQITAEVFDIGTGSTGDFTRESGEGYVKAVYNVDYSSDGTTLTLTAAASGTAAVSFTDRANTAGSATLTNTAANVVSATAGTAFSGAQNIQLAVGKLFTLNNTLVTAFKGVTSMTGSFAIRVAFTNFTVVDQNGNSVTSIEMVAKTQ